MKPFNMEDEQDNCSFAVLSNFVDTLHVNRSELGLSSGSLNHDTLFSIFGERGECLGYFIGLWEEMNRMKSSEEVKDCPCDPRDWNKRAAVDSWRPVPKTCSVEVYEDFDGTLAVKQTVLEAGKEELNKNKNTSDGHVKTNKDSFHCGVYGCGEVLSSLAGYEAHYYHCHNFVCATCRRVFVSDFLLDIHLQENHDSYFAVLSPRIDMYRCLVEACPEKFRTADLRKEHLVSIHKFPSSFSFHQPLKLKEGRPKDVFDDSGSIRMDTSPASMTLKDSDASAMDTNCPLASASTSNSARKKKSLTAAAANAGGKQVPSAVCFGRGSQRAFTPRRGRGSKGHNWYQTAATREVDTAVDIEAVDMTDLATALM